MGGCAGRQPNTPQSCHASLGLCPWGPLAASLSRRRDAPSKGEGGARGADERLARWGTVGDGCDDLEARDAAVWLLARCDPNTSNRIVLEPRGALCTFVCLSERGPTSTVRHNVTRSDSVVCRGPGQGHSLPRAYTERVHVHLARVIGIAAQHLRCCPRQRACHVITKKAEFNSQEDKLRVSRVRRTGSWIRWHIIIVCTRTGVTSQSLAGVPKLAVMRSLALSKLVLIPKSAAIPTRIRSTPHKGALGPARASMLLPHPSLRGSFSVGYAVARSSEHRHHIIHILTPQLALALSQGVSMAGRAGRTGDLDAHIPAAHLGTRGGKSRRECGCDAT